MRCQSGSDIPPTHPTGTHHDFGGLGARPGTSRAGPAGCRVGGGWGPGEARRGPSFRLFRRPHPAPPPHGNPPSKGRAPCWDPLPARALTATARARASVGAPGRKTPRPPTAGPSAAAATPAARPAHPSTPSWGAQRQAGGRGSLPLRPLLPGRSPPPSSRHCPGRPRHPRHLVACQRWLATR